ncbi:MAG: peptide chain release factor 2 [Firmicutes bacterium]|nr:peptide chain release factor 2 [Bacillota bacterium]
MILLDDIKQKYASLDKLYADCYGAFDVEEMQKRLSGLEALQHAPEFYKDPKAAQKVNAEAKGLEKQLAELGGLKERLSDLDDFISLVEEEGGEEYVAEITEALWALETELDKLYLSTLLTGEYDSKNAILSLHAGAGGTEAQDWVEMLYRMYKMYADKNDFSVEELDYLAGDEAGIKSVTFLLKGGHAYGYLKAEKGVHRLVRISPFDANARRHTSFASLEVMPEIEYDVSIKIAPEDLKTDTYRSGGAGGQHVNKTDSAVRITHLPTGIVVQCQNERSQIQNRETAMKMLISKLVEKRERENSEKAGAISGTLKKIEWGSQIRSYVFQPYTLVKDHRTNYEEPDVQRVMNGGLDGFIFEYLKKSRG